jgi:hypothetical protein
MAQGPSRDPIVTNPPADEDTGSDSEAENITAMASSPTNGASLMAKGEIPELSDFFKKTSIIDDECQAYHERGWLTGNVISSIPEVDVPIVEGSTVVCFESHLVAGLGLSPSRFLVTIMGYLNCELFHYNPNAISALSTFVMLVLAWNRAGHQFVRVLLFPRAIFQSRLWRNRALSLLPPPRRIYSDFLQELLERIPREVGPSRHAQTSVMGKQSPLPPDHQG